MAGENEPYDTDAVLRKIRNEAVSDIMQDKKPDAELLNILNSRIVTLVPNRTAVEQAVDDIRNLAKRRMES